MQQTTIEKSQEGPDSDRHACPAGLERALGSPVALNASAGVSSSADPLGAMRIGTGEPQRALAMYQRLAQAVAAAAEAIVLTDCQGRIELINPAFTRVTGYTHEEVRGKTPRVLKSGQHPPEFYADLWQTILAGEVYSGRVVNRRKDGSRFHAALTIAPLVDERGQTTGYVGVQRDVSEVIEREAALADALARAQVATRAKSDFLAKMSHELRTPLNSVIGFTELMLEDQQDPPDERRAWRLEKVHRNARNLLALINDILDLSKIEAGKITLRVQDVDLIGLVRECLDSAQPLVQTGVALGLIGDDLPAGWCWRGDGLRLRQVLMNLLGNAAKFTGCGAIRVRVTVGDAVRITVEDTGVGIPESHHELIFAEFEQVDGTTTRAAGGTGLGLAISRKLARLMGGDITVCSTPGQGSCFTVQVPRDAPGQCQAGRGLLISGGQGLSAGVSIMERGCPHDMD